MVPTANVVAELTLSALRESGSEELPFYEQLLRSSFEARPPPFSQRWYGDAFREQAEDAGWLARSLVTNAEKEAEGARVLWKMAGRISSDALTEQVHRHAVDESNHARYYVAMLGLSFPGCADEEVQAQLEAISPRYSIREPPERSPEHEDPVLTLDALVQMNIGEIRTRLHQLLLCPVLLHHCPPEQHARVKGLIKVILGDETRHIAYTARALEQAAREGHARLVRDMMFNRLEDFNRLTLREVNAGDFSGS